MIRPVGVSAGGIGLVLAWLGGVAIAQLTGATPVVITLAAGFVAGIAALVDGIVSIVRTHVRGFVLPRNADVGDSVPIAGRVDAPRPVYVEVRSGGATVADGWAGEGHFDGTACFESRGVVAELDVRVRSAGLLGLVWWGRRTTVEVGPLYVAPVGRQGDVSVERVGMATDGDLAGVSGAISGEIDGVRPWHDGDSEKFVHWASTMRSGELIVHDRRQTAGQRWLVRARSGTASPDEQAAAARFAIEHGLRSGAVVTAAVDQGDAVVIEGAAAAVEWVASADLGEEPRPRRTLRERFRRVEPDATATASARWWAALATLVSLWMLAGALGYTPVAFLAIAVGVVGGAAVSVRTLVTGVQPSAAVRLLLAVGALLGFAMVVAATGRLDGLLSVLRGPLPMVLVVLIVLHGFECRDRRTIRAALGISAVVLMYASGLRVDGAIAWWLVAWAVSFGVAMAKLSGPTERFRTVGRWAAPARRWTIRTAGAGLAGVSTLGVLAVVPVPSGPARLTLPTLIEDAEGVPNPGGVAGPDGSPRDAGSAPDTPGSDRAPAGQAGGYVGFAETMDTSVRGNLSDEIVMRVRAPEPDFWRGQTFSTFDGRRWYVDDEPGRPRSGPNIQVPPALGDLPIADDVEVTEFIQTYFLETDMPNVLFHSSRPQQVIADTDVWTRPDGALRAMSVLPEGSIYTVVSERARVDETILRRQRHIGPRLNDRGREVLARYLEVPASTSPETIALADELAAGLGSTYDVVRAYEAWMTDNVEYDLDAPLPDPGEDAVHDFLFDSRLGFCEQIASALTIMLRTQGVPARLATGYVSGTRDEVAGVFEVRASDAHAWVEVWFPETGWQAFDPTAAVPLSANAEIDSVGADVVGGALGLLADRPLQTLSLVALAAGALAATRVGRTLVDRRRRGRWGVLQDRFAALATGRGGPPNASNPARADRWSGADDEAVARLVAERLDRVAFDPAFADEDSVFAETRELVGTLRSGHR